MELFKVAFGQDDEVFDTRFEDEGGYHIEAKPDASEPVPDGKLVD